MLVPILFIIGFFICGVIISIVCNILLLRFSESLGIRNKNDVIIRWSNESKPSLGGISFFFVFIFSTIAHVILFPDENIFHHPNFHFEYAGLFIAGTLAFFMGLTDDAYNTKPLIKLVVQILCGLVFVWTNTIVDLFHTYWLDAAFTVCWVVIIMNSLNMLDNMDGITGTTVLFILLSCFFGYWILNGMNADVWTLTLVAVIGAVIGFLKYNIHPSKLFMGDAGSQFIGLFVAFFGIKCLWNVGSLTDNHSWTGIVLALVAFTPAAADTLTVVINRLKKGKSPMVGGKDHTTHHLVYAGLSDRNVWYVFVLIGFLSLVASIVVILMVHNGIIAPIAFFVLFFLIIFWLLYRNTLKFTQKK